MQVSQQRASFEAERERLEGALAALGREVGRQEREIRGLAEAGRMARDAAESHWVRRECRIRLPNVRGAGLGRTGRSSSGGGGTAVCCAWSSAVHSWFQPAGKTVTNSCLHDDMSPTHDNL